MSDSVITLKLNRYVKYAVIKASWVFKGVKG